VWYDYVIEADDTKASKTMRAYTMFDKELGEWYVSVYDTRNYANSQQFFGYATKEQAEEDTPILIAKMRQAWK
jgi:hypothetical protein